MQAGLKAVLLGASGFVFLAAPSLKAASPPGRADIAWCRRGAYGSQVIPPTLSPVQENDQKRALDTLVLAFATDPVERWLYPGSQEYLTCFPAFLAAFGGRAFAEATVWSLLDFSAVALWLPPGAVADGDAIVATLLETVAPERHEDTLAVLGQMDDAHPRFPHWYLPWLGVDPSLQGRGIGGELLEQCLRIVDEDHVAAYLETPSPRTIPFYERYGFQVTGEAQAGACPPIAPMLRSAR